MATIGELVFQLSPLSSGNLIEHLRAARGVRVIGVQAVSEVNRVEVVSQVNRLGVVSHLNRIDSLVELDSFDAVASSEVF